MTMKKSKNFEHVFYKKIPENAELGTWKEFDFSDSAFVEIPHIVRINKEVKIIVDLQYPKLGIKYAIERCLIREEALERLLIACTYLPKGLAFKIWDVYRTWNLQNELYYLYKPDIIKQFDLENLSKEEQEKIVSNYVSIPNKDEIIPPLHTTGGSIDLTITDLKKGKDLELGIEFDDFSNLTNATSYEKESSVEVIRDNRRLLYNIMTEAGFTNLPSEIWHYDYGNRAWGYYKKKPAIYKGVLEIGSTTSILSFDKFWKLLKENSEINAKLEKYNWDYSRK